MNVIVVISVSGKTEAVTVSSAVTTDLALGLKKTERAVHRRLTDVGVKAYQLLCRKASVRLSCEY